MCAFAPSTPVAEAKEARQRGLKIVFRPPRAFAALKQTFAATLGCVVFAVLIAIRCSFDRKFCGSGRCGSSTRSRRSG